MLMAHTLTLLQEMRQNRTTEPEWSLARTQFADLYLIELRNVSQGSWQPVIARAIP